MVGWGIQDKVRTGTVGAGQGALSWVEEEAKSFRLQ